MLFFKKIVIYNKVIYYSNCIPKLDINLIFFTVVQRNLKAKFLILIKIKQKTYHTHINCFL